MTRLSALYHLLAQGTPGQDDVFFSRSQPKVVNLLEGFFPGDDDYDAACVIIDTAHADSWDAWIRQHDPIIKPEVVIVKIVVPPTDDAWSTHDTVQDSAMSDNSVSVVEMLTQDELTAIDVLMHFSEVC